MASGDEAPLPMSPVKAADIPLPESNPATPAPGVSKDGMFKLPVPDVMQKLGRLPRLLMTSVENTDPSNETEKLEGIDAVSEAGVEEPDENHVPYEPSNPTSLQPVPDDTSNSDEKETTKEASQLLNNDEKMPQHDSDEESDGSTGHNGNVDRIATPGGDDEEDSAMDRIRQSDLTMTETTVETLSTAATTRSGLSSMDEPEKADDDDKRSANVEAELIVDSKADTDTQSSAADNARWVDPFDKENSGCVVDCYFTTDNPKRALSPISEVEDCVNIKFSSNSDLYIKAKDGNGRIYVFEVDAVAIAAGSPVLGKMVFQTHTRGNQNSWVFELDDDPLALKFMFTIFHLLLCAPFLAKEPRPEHIYSVLKVFSKYAVEDRVIDFWARTWIAGFRKSLCTTTLSQLKCLVIAHRLGDFKSFKSCIRNVAHEVELDGDGSMHLRNGESIPLHLASEIRAVRDNDLSSILTCLRDAYDFLADPPNFSKPRYCLSVDHHRECNQKLLGSLLSNLVEQQLWPLPDPKTYLGQVGSLVKKAQMMEIRGLYFPGIKPHEQRHGLCKVNQDEMAKNIVAGQAYLPISSDVILTMYQAGRRVGIHQDEEAEYEDYQAIYQHAADEYEEEFSSQLLAWNDDGGKH